MQYDEFVGKVQAKARLGSSGEAVTAIRATLETLSQRMVAGAAGNLASQLPREIGTYLDEESGAERFDLDEFFQRVAQKEREDLPVAVYHARAVMDTVREAVSPGQYDKLHDALPEEWAGFLDATTEGEMEIED